MRPIQYLWQSQFGTLLFYDSLGVRKNTVWRWETGMRHIPEPVARLMPYLAKEVKGEHKKRKRT